MPRTRRSLTLPALGLLAALLLAAPASALPSFLDADSGWARFLEPLFRLGRIFSSEGWASDPNGRPNPVPPQNHGPSGIFGNEGWATDPNGFIVPPPPAGQGTIPPNG